MSKFQWYFPSTLTHSNTCRHLTLTNPNRFLLTLTHQVLVLQHTHIQPHSTTDRYGCSLKNGSTKHKGNYFLMANGLSFTTLRHHEANLGPWITPRLHRVRETHTPPNPTDGTQQKIMSTSPSPNSLTLTVRVKFSPLLHYLVNVLVVRSPYEHTQNERSQLWAMPSCLPHMTETWWPMTKLLQKFCGAFNKSHGNSDAAAHQHNPLIPSHTN